jgi:uncharacterized protein (TIRG00374 family)
MAEPSAQVATAPSPTGPRDGSKMPDELHPRHILIRVAEIAVIIGVVVIAINALPGLDQVKARLTNAEPGWVVAVVVAQLGSCAGYLLVFRETFCTQMPWSLSYDIAMSELAANSLLPAGGAGGLALGVWALRQAGLPTGHIARRTVAFFVVTSAANFFTLIVVGLAVFLGVLSGRNTALLGLVPAVITAGGVLIVVVSPKLLRAVGDRGTTADRETWRGRAKHAFRALLKTTADGVEQAISLLRAHSFGVIIGSFSYMAFDIMSLGFSFAAVGHEPAIGILVLGYLIGQLGNLIPLPGGVGGTEGALVGMFALYGVNVSDAAAAVLLYRLFQLIVPALLGAPAFVMLRRKLMRADRPALVCAPLGLEVVELPARG